MNQYGPKSRTIRSWNALRTLFETNDTRSFISLRGFGLTQSDLYIHGHLSPKKRCTFVSNICTSHHFNSVDN